MSILYDEGQQAIATESRRVLDARMDKGRLLKLLEQVGEHDQPFWDTAVEQGWTALAIPEEQELIYSNEEEAFQVVSGIDDGFNIYHIGLKDDFSETDFDELLTSVGALINANFAERYGLSGFTIDEEYSYTLDFGPDRKIAWVLSAANEGITGQDGLTYVVYVYMTVLMSSEKTFMSIATIPIPAEFIILTATLGGLDCTNPGIYGQQCGYMEKVFETFSATHLTTFAY